VATSFHTTSVGGTVSRLYICVSLCVCACERLGEQLVHEFERNQDGKFENICLEDTSRPTSLIRLYGNVYSDERVELLDVLELSRQGQDDLEQGRTESSDMISSQEPEQMLLSILVVSSVHENNN